MIDSICRGSKFWTGPSISFGVKSRNPDQHHGERSAITRHETSAVVHPRVSVITIFLNAERFLTEAVESVLAQTFRDLELLLVDDGSDATCSRMALALAERHEA